MLPANSQDVVHPSHGFGRVCDIKIRRSCEADVLRKGFGRSWGLVNISFCFASFLVCTDLSDPSWNWTYLGQLTRIAIGVKMREKLVGTE